MELPYTYFTNLSAELPEIPPDSIISRTIYSDEQVKAVLFGFAQGQELSEHTASQAALLYFVQGEAQLSLGREQQEARPGTWVRMAPGLTHSVQARTPLVMLLLLLRS
ncbi:MAG TPA: cupin domain-containing protein [Anaerolineales bacterium]|jgi:quercetin dioxygenase-like cupin family protein|nr:cupin domain-containing protein [Anaerolineales bacterium]